jgi:Spy/CpxP family protein refolding chaperone
MAKSTSKINGIDKSGQRILRDWIPALVLVSFILTATSILADSYQSKYAGEEQRAIKSLSNDDISELQRGGGWGLAKAAELNGFPGPAHILEMAKEINLTAEQEREIQKIYDEMKLQAIALGEQLIRLETDMDNGFSSGDIDQATLEKLVHDIEAVRAELRIVHLSTHLQTPGILSNDQIALYKQLRGYSTDPCQKIPVGHDAAMWKKHNGCK